MIAKLAAAFPGEFTGASLKHVEGPSYQPTTGLPFPGEFTGASLKQYKGGAYHTLLTSFPGEFTGASLKRGFLAARTTP